MGLSIRGMGSNKKYSYSTNSIQRVRYLACKIDGFKGSLGDFLNTDDAWKEYSRFRQLLHFSDEKGVLIPELYLEDI